MRNNKGLHKAKTAKNDEFYTKYEDIEKELKYYIQHFNNKTIYCNCDDYNKSNFFKYFKDNFKTFKLKKLITTSYIKDGKGLYSEFDGETLMTGELTTEGSFDSEESLNYLQQADIVITNPPFSLFRRFMSILFDSNKQFIILGNVNGLTYKSMFSKIIEHKVWFGYKYNGTYDYILPNGDECTVGGPVWFTNLDNNKKEYLELTETYEEGKYHKYDNYDAINVDRIKNIPYDYDGVIGVPITALKYLCPDGLLHFDTPIKKKEREDMKLSSSEREMMIKTCQSMEKHHTSESSLSRYKLIGNEYDLNIKKGRGYINGKRMYGRLFIQRLN